MSNTEAAPAVDEKRHAFVTATVKTELRRSYGHDHELLVPVLVDIIEDPADTNQWGEDKTQQLKRKIWMFYDGGTTAENTAKRIMAAVA